MDVLDNLKYTKEHEWVRTENGNVITVGITDYAQAQLGDVVYLELPEKGETVTRGESCGVVESVKAVSDIYAPATGDVVEINDALKQNPARVNEDCFGEAWMFKVEVASLEELDELLDHTQYAAYIAEESA